MKSIIICFFCLAGIFTFVELNESSNKIAFLDNLLPVEVKKSEKDVYTEISRPIKQKCKATIPNTHQKESTRKKITENQQTKESINFKADQEFAKTESEILVAFDEYDRVNETKIEAIPVDNTIKSINLTDQESVQQSTEIKVLSAKIEKPEDKIQALEKQEEYVSAFISTNGNITTHENEEKGVQTINEDGVPQNLLDSSETSMREVRNMEKIDGNNSFIDSFNVDNSQTAQMDEKTEKTINDDDNEAQIPLNSPESPRKEIINIENKYDDNTDVVGANRDNLKTGLNQEEPPQIIVKDESEKLFEIALISNMKGNHQNAIDIYEKLLNENPDHKETLYNLAMSKIELNSIKEGCILLNKSLKKGVTQAKDMIYQYCRW